MSQFCCGICLKEPQTLKKEVLDRIKKKVRIQGVDSNFLYIHHETYATRTLVIVGHFHHLMNSVVS